ncbi:MAG: hypothetical protein ACD_45C00473G0010 [uncultured bacterium]|nr:MAG: hypothetical protein ACD_45C00473G0010 [uncultured bacterium]
MKDILNLVGNTPLIELKSFSTQNARLFAKLEMFNPTCSIKDRIVLHILNQARQQELISPGATIIEATSGNTGAALAMMGAILGYKIILTTPEKTSRTKISAMQAYGADVRVCPNSAKENEPEHYISLAKKLHATIPGSFMLNQYDNPANVEAHYLTTGPEIFTQMQGKIDYLVACGSSGGTVTGVGKFLKEHIPALKIIMPDPIGSVYYSYFKTGKENKNHIQSYAVEGVGKDMICSCMDFSLLDDVVQFTDKHAFAMVKKLALQEGIFAGGSSGAALYVSDLIIKQSTKLINIVVVFPDSGLKYPEIIRP